MTAHDSTFESDYQKYRGKCKEMSEELVAKDPTLRLVRGHYDCPIWGKEPHWWTVDKDGVIHDPTKNQFPSKGIGTYVEFDGIIDCAECGERVKEEHAIIYGSYGFCSEHCCGTFVGIYD